MDELLELAEKKMRKNKLALYDYVCIESIIMRGGGKTISEKVMRFFEKAKGFTVAEDGVGWIVEVK